MSNTKPRNARAERAVRDLLVALGQDPDREGLRDTPRRVSQAIAEMTAGEQETAETHLQVTFDGGDYDEVIALTGIPFTSMCEHHLLPFSGVAAVAYLPGIVPPELTGSALDPSPMPLPEKRYRVVGISKLARVVEVFARRLQLQEKLTMQVAKALEEHLQPRGVAVRVEATHGCMECRGVLKPGVVMKTQALLGTFGKDAALRAEVLALLSS